MNATAESWRRRAADLEHIAQCMRSEGDPLGAEELEDAAADYYAAADELELGIAA